MYSIWTKNIADPEEKQNFERTLRGSTTVIRRLQEILQELEKSVDKSDLNVKAFDSPNWALKQAFHLGYRLHNSQVQALLNLDQKEKQ